MRLTDVPAFTLPVSDRTQRRTMRDGRTLLISVALAESLAIMSHGLGWPHLKTESASTHQWRLPDSRTALCVLLEVVIPA